MYGFALSDEQHAFVDAVRDLAQRECGTREQRDTLTQNNTEPHNAALYKKVADLGWLGVAIPTEFGGSGGDMVDLCLFLEEIFHGQVPIGGFPVSAICAGPYERFGTDEQKQEILTGIAGGAVEAIAMSEPEAGSDVGNLRCKAERRNGGYIVNGQKTWISEAQHAEHILLVCRTQVGPDKHKGLTMLSIPATADGIEIRGIETMGGRVVNDVFFNDCHVAGDRLVGVEGQAWMQLMTGLNTERLIIAAQSVGLAQRALDDVLGYVKEREQFGRPIGSFQAISHRIADLATEVACARLLTYAVARLCDENPGVLFPKEASMAKLKATETGKKVALEGMQMMGGYGYATEYDMQNHVRANLVSTIYGGTSEIQRDIIAKTHGL
jgi:isovaleryl-CoA dehydrogenase